MCQKSRLLLLFPKCAAQQEIYVFLSKRSRAVMMEIFIDQAISRVYSCRLNQIHNHMDSFLRCDVLRASGLKSKRPHPSWHLDKIHRGARSTSDWIEDMLLAQVRLKSSDLTYLMFPQSSALSPKRVSIFRPDFGHTRCGLAQKEIIWIFWIYNPPSSLTSEGTCTTAQSGW